MTQCIVDYRGSQFRVLGWARGLGVREPAKHIGTGGLHKLIWQRDSTSRSQALVWKPNLDSFFDLPLPGAFIGPVPPSHPVCAEQLRRQTCLAELLEPEALRSCLKSVFRVSPSLLNGSASTLKMKGLRAVSLDHSCCWVVCGSTML